MAIGELTAFIYISSGLVEPSSPLYTHLASSLKIFTSETSAVNTESLLSQVDSGNQELLMELGSLHGVVDLATTRLQGNVDVMTRLEERVGLLSDGQDDLLSITADLSSAMAGLNLQMARLETQTCPACQCSPTNLTSVRLDINGLLTAQNKTFASVGQLGLKITEQNSNMDRLSRMLVPPVCPPAAEPTANQTELQGHCFNLTSGELNAVLCYSQLPKFTDGLRSLFYYLDLVIRHYTLSLAIFGRAKKIIW